MPRVVVNKNSPKLPDAAGVCPVSAYRKGPNGELVIDPTVCIDCGVCQSEVDDGDILEDSEASKEDIDYNANNASKWEEA